MKQPGARRESSNKLLFPLYYRLSVLTKVYVWVTKVTSSLSKTHHIALGMRPGGA